jgi:hypothetical protein
MICLLSAMSLMIGVSKYCRDVSSIKTDIGERMATPLDGL